MNVEIHGPRLAHRVRANRAGLRSIVLDHAQRFVSRVITYENRVVGGFIAADPSLRILPSPSLRRQIGCFFHQGARAMDRWGHVSATLRAERPLASHWYLAVLGVDPELQGQGVGGALLDGLTEIVAAAPAPVHLECDREASVRFYLSRGFSLRGEREVHGVRCQLLGRAFADEPSVLCDPVRQA